MCLKYLGASVIHAMSGSSLKYILVDFEALYDAVRYISIP